jgi:hypothetical protein
MLTRRAHLRGTSFSEEVGEAVDFYREVSVETREERKELAVEANCTADRIIQRLDRTIAHVDAVLQRDEQPSATGRVSRKGQEVDTLLFVVPGCVVGVACAVHRQECLCY